MRKRKTKTFGLASKKANVILDSAMVLVVLFIFSIVAFLGYQAYGELRTDILPELNTNAQTSLNESYTRFPSLMDGLIVFIFIGLWGMTIVASFMIDSHPVFFIFSIILLIFIIIAGAIFGNFYEEFFQDSLISGVVVSFPATNWILTHLLQLSIGIGLSIGLVLFGKSRL